MPAPAHEGSKDPRAVDSEIALRELPEALILVFDEELRFVLSAGQALARSGSASATFRAGQLIADAFPADLWRQIEPLCRSALQGETRSRELWTTDGRHGLMVDIGPLRPGALAPQRSEQTRAPCPSATASSAAPAATSPRRASRSSSTSPAAGTRLCRRAIRASTSTSSPITPQSAWGCSTPRAAGCSSTTRSATSPATPPPS